MTPTTYEKAIGSKVKVSKS